jgi:hypothetical protein
MTANDPKRTNSYMKIALLSACAVAVFYAIYVTVLVWRSGQYSTGQKWLQTMLVWALPLLGAMLCHAVIRRTPKPVPRNPFPATEEHQLPIVSARPRLSTEYERLLLAAKTQ